MLWAIAILLLFLWVVGAALSAQLSIHVLLIVALGLIVFQLVRENGRR